MKFSELNLRKKVNMPSLNLSVTEREKKLLAVLGVLIFIMLSYYYLYQPLSARIKTLKSEKAKADFQVTAAKTDLAHEGQILQDYKTALDKVNKDTSPFFPKVYPYLDRYILFLEKAAATSGAAITGINFSDPEVGGVQLPKQDNSLMLPGYTLQDLAKKINKANLNVNPQSTSTPEAPRSAGTAANSANKALPADALLRLPSTLEIKGSYTQIRALITNLENLKRAVAIESLDVTSGDSGGLSARLTLSFYALEKVDNGADPFNLWTVQGSYGKSDLFN